MPLLQRSDTYVHYTDSTPAAGSQDIDAPPMVLVHGLLTSGRVWDVLTPLLRLHHRVITLDLRGHGLSGTGSSSMLSDAVDDVYALVDHLDLPMPVVVGASIGAVIATEFAHRYPSRLSRAVLIGSIAHATAEPGPFTDAMQIMCEGLRRDPHATARAAVPSWFGPLGGVAAQHWVLQLADETTAAAAELGASVLGWDPRHYLPDLEVPLRYLHGSADEIPRATVAEAAALSPNAALVDLDGAGHMSYVEMPARVADLIGQ